MKTGSQSNVFDYNDGSVNTMEAVPPTTRMYPPATMVVPNLPWQKEDECHCPGPYHRPLCPEKRRDEKTG